MGLVQHLPKLRVYRFNFLTSVFEGYSFTRIPADGTPFTVTTVPGGGYALCIRNPGPNLRPITVGPVAIYGF